MILLLILLKYYLFGVTYSALFFFDDFMRDYGADTPLKTALRRYVIAVLLWPIEIALRPWQRWKELKRRWGQLT